MYGWELRVKFDPYLNFRNRLIEANHSDYRHKLRHRTARNIVAGAADVRRRAD
jgi:hypothetical protein